MAVVGFDFGYQSCYIAIARQGGIETVSNEYSSRLTSNVVSFGEKCRHLGEAAKQYQVSNIKNTVWGHKKLIGRKFNDPQVQNEKQRLPYEIANGVNGDIAIKVNYQNDVHSFSPEQITAMVFTKLKKTTEIALGVACVDCVISVPCFWTDVQRRAMLHASQIAGLKCLRIFNDTTAVALSYGIYKQDLPAPEEKPKLVVFVDLGHGSLQISACAFNKGKLKMLAIAFDPNTGGRDLDTYLANHFAAEFKQRYKVDAFTKPKAYQRLLTECEKLKKLMSANSSDMSLNIECFMDDKDVSGTMNRQTMETLAEPFFQRIEAAMSDCLAKSKLKPDDPYTVEIVGGATRVPAVKLLVQKIFKREPSTTLNQDEAVARGCALQCAILSPTFRVRDFSIVDIQPFSITLRWRSMAVDEADDMEVFNQFHPIPQSKMLTFFRSEPFTIESFYTDPTSLPHPDKQISSFLIEKVVPASNGESSKVKVKLRVNSHGIFSVSQATLVEKLDPNAVEDDEKMDTTQDTDAPPAAASSDKTATTESEPEKMQTDEKPKDEASANQNDEEKGDGDVAASEAEKKGDKKTKKSVKYHELPISATAVGLTAGDVNILLEKEGQMVAQDKLEKERADAKNALEEYVYELRDKLYSEYSQFITEKDKEVMCEQLTKTENWLYEEGEDVNKQEYISRLAGLKTPGDKVASRYREFLERPAALEAFGKNIQQVQKMLDLYDNKDENYVHLEAAEVDRVRKLLTEKKTWFEKKSAQLTSRPLTEEPPVLVSQIRTESELLTNISNPILNKPKPKVEPPKEEPKPADEAKDQKTEKENSTEEKGANGPTEDMDLD